MTRPTYGVFTYDTGIGSIQSNVSRFKNLGVHTGCSVGDFFTVRTNERKLAEKL